MSIKVVKVEKEEEEVSIGQRVISLGQRAEVLNLLAAAKILSAPYKTVEAPQSPVVLNARQKLRNGTLTVQEIADGLANNDFGHQDGRTLAPNAQWDGRDIPGRGAAAKRRLAQMAKIVEKKAKKASQEAMTQQGGSEDGKHTSDGVGSTGADLSDGDSTQAVAGEGSTLAPEA